MTPRRRQLKFRTAGFTLVELLVVIVLIALLSALIVPAMKGTFEAEMLNSTSRRLRQALGIAYRESVTSRQPHRLRLDTTRGRFLIERRALPGDSDSGFVPVENVSGAKGALDRRIRITLEEIEEPPADENQEPAAEEPRGAATTAADTILFQPDGTTEKREIRLRDRQGFGVALRLNPITSRVKLVPLNRE